ncbi:hypothetical protein [Corallococcus silvisoli]|uniref:hypothetical protein n=1 Tax=Corallococcus silvisoli TaxID=2697031 RepID=UPI001376CD40|nr:hypothetical protein [Corallococcus silvisoli]NBD12355.1 hypothetical protein [Corallococcus silvisoli]
MGVLCVVGVINAVAVHVEGRLVGYLSREDALLFKGLLDDMAPCGEVATCAALIVGGWDRGSQGTGSFGVQLNLVHPDKAPPEASIISKAITDLWAAKGPAWRRTVLRNALATLRTNEAKMQMLNEASSVEVVPVLEAVSSLKMKTAKKRRLEDALAALKADEVPDELQQEQVASTNATELHLAGPRNAPLRLVATRGGVPRQAPGCRP